MKKPLSNHPRETKGLSAHAVKKAEEAKSRTTLAIDALFRQGKKIDFNTVARAAGVARSYLYNNPEFRNRISELRQAQGAARLTLVASGELDRKRTEKSTAVIIEAQKHKIAGLEAELKRTKDELKRALGKQYDEL